MKQRIITMLILIAGLIPIVILGGVAFEVLVITAAIIAFCEILNMAKIKLWSPEAVIGMVGTASIVAPRHYFSLIKLTPSMVFSLTMFFLLAIMVLSKNKFSFERVGVITLSGMYVGLGTHYVYLVRHNGIYLMVFLLVAIHLTDIFAYLVGRQFGKRPLAPHISPNKTIEGAVGGTLIASIICFLFVIIFPNDLNVSNGYLFFMAVCISVAGQLGDLIESALKRFYGVKDSGNLFPGHGGVLDRFDSILFGAIACQLLLILGRG